MPRLVVHGDEPAILPGDAVDGGQSKSGASAEFSPEAASVYCGDVRSAAQTLESLGAVWCLTTLLVAGPVRAQAPDAFAFSWQAPAGCPDVTEVRAEIARLLGGAVGAVPGGRLQARAVVTQGQSWGVMLQTESLGDFGQRSLEAASCRELANATALIVALMIDPDAVAAHASAPSASPPPPPPAPPPPPPPAPSQPAPKPSRALDYPVGLIVAASQGTLPSTDVGLGGALGVSGKGWRLEVRASYGLRRDQKVAVPPPVGGYGQFNFFSALLAGCLNLGGPKVAWGPCAVGEFGVVSANGGDVNRSLPAQVPWWAVGAGGYAVIPLGRRWAIPVHLDALLPLHRTEYVFRDDQGNVSAHVFKAALIGIRVSAGVELHF